MNAMRSGDLEIMLLSDGPCANIAPSCSLFTMPFLFKNEEQAYKVSDSKVFMEQIKTEFLKSDMRPLAIYSNGWRQIYGNSAVIKDPGQIKGQKFRVMQSPAYMKLVTEMGGDPTPTAWPQVYEQTKAKIVFGFENTLSPFLGTKLYEVNKYVTLSRHIYSVLYVVVSEKMWKQLKPDVQEKIEKFVWDERVNQRKENDRLQAEALDKLKKMKDMTVYELSTEERQKFANATSGVFKEFQTKFSPELLNMVKESTAK